MTLFRTYLFATVMAFCAVQAMAEKRALVIGNAAYDPLPPLFNTLGDAAAYAKAFQSLGFKVSHHTDLSELALDQAMSDFLDSIGPGDDVAFFFAGHGWSYEGNNYLLPIDAPNRGSPRLLARRSVALKNGVTGVLDEMRSMGSGLQLAIVDACRDNPFAGAATRAAGVSRGLARVVPEQGSFIVFSAGEGQTALDRLDSDGADQGLSVFSRHFLPLLTSDMYLEDAISEAQLQTARAAATMNHLQTPAYYDQTLGKTCLRSSCAQPAAYVEAVPKVKPSWSANLDVPGLEALKARDAIAMPDGGVMVAYGYREFPGTPPWVGVARFDGAGQLQWDKRLEALKNKDQSTFLIVASMMPWGDGGAAIFQRPNFVSIDRDGLVQDDLTPVPDDLFAHYPMPDGQGGFVIIGEGPLDPAKGDYQYRFVGRMAPGDTGIEIAARIPPPEAELKLAQMPAQLATDGGLVMQLAIDTFRAYDPQGQEIWTQKIDLGAHSQSFIALPGGTALVADTRDVSVAGGDKLAQLRLQHLSAAGAQMVGAPETLRFVKFPPFVVLTPIRNGNGAIMELTSGDTGAQYFRRLDRDGTVLWTRNFGSSSGSVIATFADRGDSGAVFLDFRHGDDQLRVIAVDDQGQ